MRVMTGLSLLLAASPLLLLGCRRADSDATAVDAAVVTPGAGSVARKRKPHRSPPVANKASLPDLVLPDVTAHAASQNIMGEKSADQPCGSAHSSQGDVALECLDESSTKIDGAATPVIAHAVLVGNSSGALPSRVDHRALGLEGPMRNQGKAPACTGFSLAATMDQAVAGALGHPGNVSVLHLWSRYAVTNMGAATQANKNHPLAEEPIWPYSSDTAMSFRVAAECKAGTVKGAQCAKSPDRAPQEEADKHPYVTLLGTTKVDSSQAEALERKLAGGQDIWFCAKIGGHLSCGSKGCNLTKMAGGDDVYVRDFDAKSEPGGHCMSLAGYQKTKAGTYFLIHNSWGEKWGNKGYAFMHEKTFLHNVEKGATYVVEVQSSAHPPGGHASAQVKEKACTDGMLRDSHTGACEDPCPDGSARHDGVCAQTAGCDAGQVNVTGTCVQAAPTNHGTDAASGVTFSCLPGGCSYSIPKGKLGCTDDTCNVSCAAPRFELAEGSSGLFCTP